jgi:hypothetical protein
MIQEETMTTNDHMEPESKREELLFEYEELRKEILSNFTLGVQILGGTVTFVAVIMTLGFSEAIKSYLAKAALFFVAEAIAFIGLNQIMNLAHGTYQIASYLRVFTESQLRYVKWETRLNRFRGSLKQIPYEEHTGSVRYTYAFIIIVNFILGSIFALLDAIPEFQFRGFRDIHRFAWEGFRSSPLTGVFIFLIMSITIYLLTVAWKQYRIFVIEHDNTYTCRWNEIKSSEDQS